jgi:hypothetical protein
MELVAGLFSAVAVGLAETGTAAAATTATAAATTATTATVASTASTALTVLQGVATAGSILTSLASGQMGSQTAKLKAQEADLEAQEKALRIRRDYLTRVGASRVAFAASGVDIGGGQAVAVEDALAGQRDLETGLALTSGKIKREQYEMQGEAASLTGVGQAAKTGIEYGISIARRG